MLQGFAKHRSRTSTVIALILIAAVCAGYQLSRLAFSPVPWPDGSAFYLPGVEMFSWPPLWRMHAQAAFVPSYDSANFNTMPGLPFMLGLASRLGLTELFGAVQSTRFVSWIALWLWAYLLWDWLDAELTRPRSSRPSGALRREDPSLPLVPEPGARRFAALAATAIGAAGLLDPVNRWGTNVVRTETWIALAWIYLLREIWRFPVGAPSPQSSRALWRIAGGLAFAAYFHFEAIILVPAVFVAFLLPGMRPFRSLPGIAWRTVVWLSPWLYYVISRWSFFLDQMAVQFNRLEQGNHYFENAYLIFHNLFISHGSPVSWPKFFNVGKGFFWLELLLCVLGTLIVTVKSRGIRRPELAAIWGAALTFVVSYYLWMTKPEVWFITLCHLMIWPWAGTLALAAHQLWRPRAAVISVVGLAGAYAAISAFAHVAQDVAIPRNYDWATYTRWIDCIEQSFPAAPTRTALRIWQPHVPDVLIELEHRGRGKDGIKNRYDLTRALDFQSQQKLAVELAHRTDVVLLTRSMNRPLLDPDYVGPPRAEDWTLMKDVVEVPFGPLITENARNREMRICQVGPFWANVAVRKPR